MKAVIETLRVTLRARAAGVHGMRRCLLRRFPYVVRYRIEGSVGKAENVVIYAIQHVHRDQGGWLQRLPDPPEWP